jgi:hypothetical protein
MIRLAAVLVGALLALSPAAAEEKSNCAAAPLVLWGDGEHDDTAALNAWFRGDPVVWGETHQSVGAEIADRTFLLSAAVYVSSGTGRKLERFKMVWPAPRNEQVSGGTILSGDDPKQPPVAEGITKINADPDEGVPYEAPGGEPREHGVPRHCLTS